MVYVFGSKRAAVWMESLTEKLGIRPEGDFKANMVLVNPFEKEEK